jgi:hypothetical protein
MSTRPFKRPPATSATNQPRSTRLRLVAFSVTVVVVVAGVTAYLVHAHDDQQRAIKGAPPIATMALSQVESQPRIVFRSNSLAHYGVIAMVPMSKPGGARALTSTKCDRIYATGVETLCVSLDRTVVTYQSQLLNSQFGVMRDFPLAGIPSRARLSADGSLAATTAFTSVGDTYASTTFSTRTYISTTSGTKKSLFLEDFTLIQDGRKIAPTDRNYWGVTFAADDDHFYATVGFGGHTYLVHGDLATTTMTTLGEDAECPSLSPDGKTLVYKKRDGMPAGHWRLTALNLATGKETALAETRSVDDQVEWLDNNHVLYALPGSGGNQNVDDVWTVPADGSGHPVVLIPEASSPAVVR